MYRSIQPKALSALGNDEDEQQSESTFLQSLRKQTQTELQLTKRSRAVFSPKPLENTYRGQKAQRIVNRSLEIPRSFIEQVIDKYRSPLEEKRPLSTRPFETLPALQSKRKLGQASLASQLSMQEQRWD